MGTGGSFPDSKEAGAWSWSPQPNAKVKNGEAIPPLVHTSLWRGAYLIKHRGNFNPFSTRLIHPSFRFLYSRLLFLHIPSAPLFLVALPFRTPDLWIWFSNIWEPWMATVYIRCSFRITAGIVVHPTEVFRELPQSPQENALAYSLVFRLSCNSNNINSHSIH
jgi:hypothetical protein